MYITHRVRQLICVFIRGWYSHKFPWIVNDKNLFFLSKEQTMPNMIHLTFYIVIKFITFSMNKKKTKSTTWKLINNFFFNRKTFSCQIASKKNKLQERIFIFLVCAFFSDPSNIFKQKGTKELKIKLVYKKNNTQKTLLYHESK